MRRALYFVDHIVTMANNRKPGTHMSIHSTTWPELKDKEWCQEVTNIIIQLNYIPFKSLKYKREPNGDTLLSIVTRPGAELAYLPLPSLWARIKARFTGI